MLPLNETVLEKSLKIAHLSCIWNQNYPNMGRESYVSVPILEVAEK